jgi:hypothetical protein
MYHSLGYTIGLNDSWDSLFRPGSEGRTSARDGRTSGARRPGVRADPRAERDHHFVV